MRNKMTCLYESIVHENDLLNMKICIKKTTNEKVINNKITVSVCQHRMKKNII